MHIQFRVVAGCNIGQKLGYNPERSPVYLRVNSRKWAVVVHDALDVFVYLVLVLAVLNSIHTSNKKWFTFSNARWIQLQSTVLCKIPKFFWIQWQTSVQWNRQAKPNPPFVTFLHYSSARKHCSGEHQDREMSI